MIPSFLLTQAIRIFTSIEFHKKKTLNNFYKCNYHYYINYYICNVQIILKFVNLFCNKIIVYNMKYKKIY